MRFTSPSFRTIAVSSILASVAFFSACSADSPMQPALARNDAKMTTAELTARISALALTRDVAVPQGVVRSFTFTQAGGTIDLKKETGLRIEVPAGAIPGNTLTITVTALPGKAVAYDFQPHGTVFLKPLTFRHDLKNTSWDKLGFKGTLLGGYFANASQIDLISGIAQLDELFPVTLKSSEVSFDIKHFSGYMVSSGRQAAAYDAF